MLLFSSDRHDRGSGFLFFMWVKRKFAAEYSADEMKDSWKHAGEAVRHAANEIKEDMSEMKESAQAVFEDAAEE